MSSVYNFLALLSLVLCFKADSNPTPNLNTDTKTSILESLDWSNFQNMNFLTSFEPDTPDIKCDSSRAVLVAASLSDRIKILRKGKSPDIQFSSQLLLSSSDKSKGCSGGDITDTFKFILNNGIVDNRLFPYQAKDLDNGLQCEEQTNMSECENMQDHNDYYYLFGINSYKKVSGVEEMINALQSGPIVCKILKDKNFMMYKNGIYDRSTIQGEDHMYVSLIGYGSESNIDYWIGRTSNGVEWGDKGYFRIQKGKNLLNIESYCAYGIPSNTVKLISKKTGKELNSDDINTFVYVGHKTYSKSNINSDDKANHQHYQSNRLKPKYHYILVFGPSQFGKSTFINNLLIYSNSSSPRPQMGVGNGRSTTFKVEFYKLGNIHDMYPDDIQNFDEIIMIDVPGTFDSGMTISKEQIFESIKAELLDKGVSSLDAILMFESMKDDSRKIMITMDMARELFGAQVQNSIIVLSTKWNRVEEEEREGIETYFDSLLKTLQLPNMKWHSNYGNHQIVTNKEMQRQITELGHHIKSIKPYNVEGMNNLLYERDELARKIKESYPDRYSQVDETRKEYIPEEYMKEFELDSFELVPFSDDEITKRAQELYDVQIPIPGGFIPDPSGKRIEVPTTHHLVDWVDEEVKFDLGPQMIKADDIKLPLGYFRELVKNEKKSVEVKKKHFVKDIRYKKVVKLIKKNQEKHDFEFYQDLANKQMSERFRNQFRKSNPN